jgi:hypothetical protein
VKDTKPPLSPIANREKKRRSSLLNESINLSFLSDIRNQRRTRSETGRSACNTSMNGQRANSFMTNRAVASASKKKKANRKVSENNIAQSKPKKSKNKKSKKDKKKKKANTRTKRQRLESDNTSMCDGENSDTEIILNKNENNDNGKENKKTMDAIFKELSRISNQLNQVSNKIDEFKPKPRPSRKKDNSQLTSEDLVAIAEKINKLTLESRRSLKIKFSDICYCKGLNEFEVRIEEVSLKRRREFLSYIDKLLKEDIKNAPGINVICGINKVKMYLNRIPWCRRLHKAKTLRRLFLTVR